jgi:hypothetical protein
MTTDTASAAPTKPQPTTGPTDLSDVLAALERIEAILAQDFAAVLSRKQAARYLGISPASLDRLAASVPDLRPIHPTPGRSVWRKVDLQKYLDQL